MKSETLGKIPVCCSHQPALISFAQPGLYFGARFKEVVMSENPARVIAVTIDHTYEALLRLRADLPRPVATSLPLQQKPSL
jgi:hypothetical protein